MPGPCTSPLETRKARPGLGAGTGAHIKKEGSNEHSYDTRCSGATLAFAAVAAVPALPAMAMPIPAVTHTMFAVVDNGGVLVTRQPLTVHQVVYSGGIAYTVQLVHGTEFRVTPGLPASDIGKTLVFST